MDEFDRLFQLAFFAILLVGWLLKAILERRQHRERPGPPPQDGSGPDEAEPAPAPPPEGPPPRERPGAPAERPPVSPPGAPAPAGGRRGNLRGERLVRVRPQARTLRTRVEGAPLVPDVAGRAMPVMAAFTHRLSAADQALRRRRAATWARLGASEGAAASRALVRRGVLWSEVLARPRAIAGPHQGPLARRR